MQATARVFAMTVLAAGLALAQSERSAEVQLKAAMHKEQVEGDLKEAIRLYQRIVEKYSGNREVAARALLQIGQCYEKLGQDEARKAYETVVHEFSDRPGIVKEAQVRLAALRPPAAAPRFTMIRVPTKLPRLSDMALSPDGQQLAYVSSGRLWLVPVHGLSHPDIAGPARPISEPAHPWTSARGLTWSQDGKWIAFQAWERLPDGGEELFIYFIPAAGGEAARVRLELKNYVEAYWDYRLALSPEGTWLAYTTRKAEEDGSQRSIYLAPTRGGVTRRLTDPLTREPALSPDGKRIAYVGLLKDPERPPDSPLGRQIWVTSVDGGKGELAYELPRPQRLRNPTWSPDGKWLAFLVCPRTDYATQMMLVQIRPDGRPAGTPVTVDLPRTSSEYLPGWGADNKIGLVIRTPETTALYTVPASGGKAAQLTPKEGWMPSWTPDGKRIYFAGSNLEVRASVEFIPASGGTVTRIPLKASQRVQIAYPSGGTSVSPDGKTVLFCGAYMPMSKNEGMRLFVVPVDGGEVTEFRTGMPWVYQPCWSPDGKSIAFVRSEEVPKTNKWINSICTMPVSGGKPRQISSQTDNVLDGRLAWSPNGKHIAYYSEDDKLKLAPVDGGLSSILVQGLKGYRRDSGLAWSPDGKQLAYITQDRIWKLNLETGKSEEVQTGLDAHHMQLAWSPDGTTIAFSALQGGEPELWLMSDFLPR